MSQILLLGNPRKRRARKGRSAAQKAATRKMLAANRSRRGLRRNPSKRRARRSVAVVSAAPARRRSRRSVARVARRSRRSSGRKLFGGLGSGLGGNAVSMVKSGAIGGAGAVANDVLFGLAGKVLPAGWVSPVNADGSTNWLYFAAKGGTAIGLGLFGRKVMPGNLAAKMADGALTVLSYQLMRPLVPATMLGYYNPAPTMAPRRLGAYVNTQRPRLAGMGAYVSATPGSTAAKGASVARMLRTA